jgi:hypothetical protein
VDIYDGDLHVRSIHTPSYPAALTILCARARTLAAAAVLLALHSAKNLTLASARSTGLLLALRTARARCWRWLRRAT